MQCSLELDLHDDERSNEGRQNGVLVLTRGLYQAFLVRYTFAVGKAHSPPRYKAAQPGVK